MTTRLLLDVIPFIVALPVTDKSFPIHKSALLLKCIIFVPPSIVALLCHHSNGLSPPLAFVSAIKCIVSELQVIAALVPPAFIFRYDNSKVALLPFIISLFVPLSLAINPASPSATTYPLVENTFSPASRINSFEPIVTLLEKVDAPLTSNPPSTLKATVPDVL